jgi:hypothetical protein
MTGYVLPMDDEIASSLVHVGLTDPLGFDALLVDIGDVFGGTIPSGNIGTDTFRDSAYPHAHPQDEFRHPWQYPPPPPDLPSELPLTTAGPHPRLISPVVLFGGTGTDPGIKERFETARTPREADIIGMDVHPHNHLGDSVAFSEYLLWLETRHQPQPDGSNVPVVEWNLDSDRGYGYHCWDWNRKPNTPATPAQPDPEHKLFNQPCTWPSQADPDLDPAAPQDWNPAVPLQIHWSAAGEEDPGCEPAGGEDIGGSLRRRIRSLARRSRRRV